jgi:hypothetical protein
MKTCPICVWGNFQEHPQSSYLFKKCVVCGFTVGIERKPEKVAPHTTGLISTKDDKKK